MHQNANNYVSVLLPDTVDFFNPPRYLCHIPVSFA